MQKPNKAGNNTHNTSQIFFRRALFCIGGVVACAVLSACGGGGGGGGGGDGNGGIAMPTLVECGGEMVMESECINCGGVMVPQNRCTTCEDGSMVTEGDRCPIPPPNDITGTTKTCPNGAVLPQNMDCDEYTRNRGLSGIRAASAYARGYLGQDVTVAVVDSGMRTSHVDLRDNVVPGMDFANKTNGTVITDPTGHGTGVGGIIAAAANAVGVHGVAPMAKLMPLKIGNDAGTSLPGDPNEAFEHAVSMRVPIINNSFGTPEELTGMFRGTIRFATIPGVFFDTDENRQARATAVLDIINSEDVVLVYAAGNESWQPTTGRVNLCIDEDCDTLTDIPRVSLATFIAEYSNITIKSIGRNNGRNIGSLMTVANITNAFANPESRRPIFAATLAAANRYLENPRENLSALLNDANAKAMLERWIAVGANSINNRIGDFSNGCGDAMWWCLVAPGAAISVVGHANDNAITANGGTSFAAPHVSGALAVLKSRLPNMEMKVMRAILLTTATPLGERDRTGQIGDVYGWGLLNLSAAITLQGRISLFPVGNSSTGALLKTPALIFPPQWRTLNRSCMP